MEKKARYRVLQEYKQDLITGRCSHNEFIVWDTQAVDGSYYTDDAGSAHGKALLSIRYHTIGGVHGVSDRREAMQLAEDVAAFLNARENPDGMLELALGAIDAMEKAHQAHKDLVNQMWGKGKPECKCSQQ